VFRPHSLARALEGLDAGGRRNARLNQKLYGAALAVPMGLTTSASGEPEELAAGIALLARGRAGVVLLEPQQKETQQEVPQPEVPQPEVPQQEPELVAEPRPEPSDEGPAREQPQPEPVAAVVADGTPQPRPRRNLFGEIGTIVSRVAKRRPGDAGPEPGGAPTLPAVPAAEALPLRAARRATRAQVTRDAPATTLGATALHEDPSGARTGLPEGRELRRPGSVDLVIEAVEQPDTHVVRPISTLGDPIEPLVIGDFVTEPAYDPVVGPELAAARTRLGLSVDELADRTRIRPHVIESIEVDDFAPCGGDFYARGHLRTLARVLGQAPEPLLQRFEERYASAPVTARRVFEAELATGMAGGMRAAGGGPNWGLLVGVVLVLVLVWGVVRLFETEPAQLIEDPVPVLNGSAGLDGSNGSDGETARRAAPPVKPMPVTLVATQAGTRVLVRDGKGEVVFAGPLVLGERKTLQVDPPATVRAGNAGAVEVRVRGRDRGAVGDLGEPGRRTFHRPHRG
jgi:cytoskeleton protein RodZ